MTAIHQIARRARPLMTANARAEADRILTSLGDSEGSVAAVASAFARDMQPACRAVALAMQSDGNGRLFFLRPLLPRLLGEINALPGGWAQALEAAMASEFAHGFAAGAAVPAVTVNSAALAHHRAKTLFPTDLGSADLGGLSRELLNRSVFSARVTNAHFLQEIADVIDDLLAGKINRADAHYRLGKKLKDLGYDPATGFPEDGATVPPAEPGSLQALNSDRRIDLIIDTNLRMARSYGEVVGGNTPAALHAFPARELVRLYDRATPRGSAESHSPGWLRRWNDAAASVDWEGCTHASAETPGRMIALKGSPIWTALGNGVGGYGDTLRNPYPPFAFQSGMDWQTVPRAQCVALGLIAADPAAASEATPAESQPAEASIEPDEASLADILKSLGPDFKAQLIKDLEDFIAA